MSKPDSELEVGSIKSALSTGRDEVLHRMTSYDMNSDTSEPVSEMEIGNSSAV